MYLTTNIADFKLLPKQFQRHGKIKSVYDYFILDKIVLNKSTFS